jgi:addiction module HigA family antidote
MSHSKLTPSSPGEILLEEFLEPLHISQNQLARDLGIPPSPVNDIIKGRRSISADTAIRLGLFFDMSPEFWLSAQINYDLRSVKKNLRMIKTEVHPHAA